MDNTNLFYQQLEEQSGPDYVKVVRCKDCKYYKYGKLLPFAKFCYLYLIGSGLNTTDNDFCSRGERRADNEK